jgi:hypothetical protein
VFRASIPYILFFIFLLVFTGTSFFARTGTRVFDVYVSRQYSDITDLGVYGTPQVYTLRGMSDLFHILKNEIKSETRVVVENILTYTVVSVEGFHRNTEEYIFKPLGISPEIPFSHTKLVQLRQFMDSSPWIESYDMDVSLFPPEVRVSVRESKPWLVADMGTQNWLVSTKGVLLDPLESLTRPSVIAETGGLPRLYLETEDQNSQSDFASTTEKLKYALKSLEFIEFSGGFPFRYETIYTLPMGALLVEPVEEDMGVRVLFKVTSLSDAEDVIQRYIHVIEDIKNRGENVEEIDLRYAGQVIVR